MVGLLNQGATCYLNSLLQTLYHTRLLRKAVYELDTSSDKAEHGVALELQHLFADLQTKVTAVGTQNLTKAFGWTDSQVFAQHDVQELLRELLDKLGERMKGTPKENIIKDLFCGQYATYVKCINVNCERSRTEDFFDLQLDVRGSESVIESFRKYVQEERLDGENQYDAEGFGKQDAMKGVKFLKFPPVLHLHLKRFAYNYFEDRTFKIHDRFEFPELLDLNEFVVEQQGVEKANLAYRLHSVLVHSGNDQRGHYYAYVHLDTEKSPGKVKWYKFNDEFVTRVKRRMAVDNTFGVGPVVKGDESSSSNWNDTKRLKPSAPPGVDPNASAYMLVYVQANKWDEVMCPVDSVPQSLLDRFDRDVKNKQLEKERVERNRNRGLMRVATEVDALQFDKFRLSRGRESEDWVDWEGLREIEYGDIRTATNMDLYNACEREFPDIAIPGKYRLWLTCGRKNETVRLDFLIPKTEERIDQKDFNGRIFLETQSKGEETIRPKQPKEISLLFREYDPQTGRIVPGSGAFVGNTGLILDKSRVGELWEVLANKVLGESDDDLDILDYELFELFDLNFGEKHNAKPIPYSNDVVLSDSDELPCKVLNLESAGDIIIYSRKVPVGSSLIRCDRFFYLLVHQLPVFCRRLGSADAPQAVDDIITFLVVDTDIVDDVLVANLAERLGVAREQVRLTFTDVTNPLRPERFPCGESDYKLSCAAFFQRKGPRKQPPNQTSVFYDILPFKREEASKHYLVRMIVHDIASEEPAINGTKKTLSTSSTVVRWDRPTPVRFFLEKSVATSDQLFEQVLKQVPIDHATSEIVLFVAGGGRLEKILTTYSPLDEQLVRSCPHGVPLLSDDGAFALIPDASREPRLFGEVVLLPPPSVTNRVKVAIVHCTLKDETSIPNELGVPSLMYIWESDTLGSFWKRLLDRLVVPQEASSSWRPLIGVNEHVSSSVAPRLSFLDVRETSGSVLENGVNGNGMEIITPVPTAPVPSVISVGATAAQRSKRPRVPQDEFDCLPLWGRPEVETALSRPPSSSGNNLPSLYIYIRHSSTAPGRTGTPVHGLTIRSS